MADVSGFEPKLTESKSVVLPLHYTPINFIGALDRHRTCNIQSLKLQRLPIASQEH